MKNFYLITLIFLGLSASVNAQTAKLQGKVFSIIKNVETPLPFAKVMILKPDSTVLRGVDTDFDGKYVIVGKPGLNLISVRAQEMRDTIFTVNLVEGDNPELNIQMLDFSLVVGTITVTGVKKKSPNTQQGEDNRRKDEVAASDGMSREQIQKTGDSDASSAVQRVPGVSVQDGKYVYVRVFS